MQRAIKSVGNALRGISIIFKEGRNIKIYIFCIAICALAGFYFSITQTEWMILLLFFGLVLTAESLNIALEHTLNCISHDHREDIRDAKDVAAGAVALSVIANIIAVAIIFLPKIFT